MNDITMLVDQAIAQWQEETDCGATDLTPMTAGDIMETAAGQRIKLTSVDNSKIVPIGVGYLIDEEMIQAEEDTAIIERLSSEVHDAWWEEKKSQGFHAPVNCLSAIGKLNDSDNEQFKFVKHCDHCHADMYPYEELPENIKDYDRVTVRTVLQAIKKLGLG